MKNDEENRNASGASHFSVGLGGWISVDDRLPEWASRDDTPCVANGEEIGALLTSEKVLVAIAPDNNVRIDHLTAIESSDDEYQYKWFDMYGDRVTHWMPLPEAPNVEVRGRPLLGDPSSP